MKRYVILLAVLAVSLVASNGWWAFQLLDAGVTVTYRDVSLQDHHEALAQALAILPIAARPDSTPAQVLEAAMGAALYKESFEKDGFVWVGRLGLKFDDNGRLVEAAPAWKPF